MLSGIRSALILGAMALCALPSTSGAQAIPTPDHVVVVVEENHSYAQIIGSTAAPYINSLAGKGALFTSSFGVTHPSEPNYLALFSGSTQGVTDDGCAYTFATPNLGRELLNAGLSFGGYSEDMPSVGYTGCSYSQYYRKHNPWVDWQHDISPSANDLPPSVNMPYSSWPADYTQLPTVSFVIPNQNDDMHDGTIQQADSWLQSHIDPYVQWASGHNSLLVLTWDEDNGSSGNRIATIFVGPMVRPGQYTESITHYNVLRTLEDMYGLPYAGNSAGAAAIADVWSASTPASAPAAPSDLRATAVSSTQIRLQWTDNSSDESGFRVLRSADGTTFAQVGTVGADVTTFSDSGLTRRTRYYYRVRAYNASGDSANSNTASARTRPH